ncbi:MAG: methyltransferase domain-containing protein [Nanoarchaeota archaeon]
MIRNNCLVCNSTDLVQIIDLGSHPFADTFVPKSKISEPDMIYPLTCDLCNKCGQIQTKYVTNPLARYSDIEYSYTSSNSTFSRNHWEEYSKEVASKICLKPSSLVIEIGSNDGYLSEQFVKAGNSAVGVDPSPYMAKLAKQRGVNTIISLFGNESADEILNKYEKADLIIANNVFNHSDNPGEFVKAVEKVMNDNATFVFEQPYWMDTLKSGKFDQIYHEHVSYFTVRSLKALLETADLVITSVEVVNYHGGSLRIYSKKKEYSEESETAQKMIDDEYQYGAFDKTTYEKFMKKNIDQRNKFLKRICEIKEEGYKIIAVGAAAKGNTFLNFYRLDHSLIDYVTDSSPHKKGKYTPATRIPIVGDEIFKDFDKVYALILSWNIANQLREILGKINPDIKYISPEETSNGIKDVIYQKRGIDHEDDRRAILTAFNGDLNGFKASQAKIYLIKQEKNLAGCYHDYDVAFYILEGEVKFILEDLKTKERKEYNLEKTDTLLIPSKVAYHAIAKAGTKMVGFTEMPFVSSEKNDIKYEF